MRVTQTGCAALLLAGLLAAGALAAGTRAPDPAAAGVLVGVAGAEPVAVTAEALARLPAVTLPVRFDTEHGPRQASFEGPLLWAVLDQAHAIAAGKAGQQVRQVVTVTGSDGYTADIALGEISPDFEGKQVILAERMDGAALGAGHLRVVVPGDKRGGRSVHDVARITVTPLPAAR